MAKTPTISVIERRLQGPSVFRTSSQPIPLREGKKWTVRWVNTKVSTDHLYDFKNNKGWDYATPDDLDCPVDEAGGFVRDGRIVRGDRGEEVLMKMLSKDLARVVKKKTEEANKQTFGKKEVKAAIVAGAAAEHGDRAAEYMEKHVHGVTVNDGRGPEDAA